MQDEKFRTEDGVQHGIDDDPSDDAKKGAVIGGLGGAAVGAAAGSMAGPVGAVIGAVAGGAVGAAASGAAVAAIDSVDNDDNVTGLGDDVAYDHDDNEIDDTRYAHATADPNYSANTYGGASATGGASGTMGYENVPASTGGWENDSPGIQTGGQTLSGAPDTRGIGEKAADAITGDRYDDKTGERIP